MSPLSMPHDEDLLNALNGNGTVPGLGSVPLADPTEYLFFHAQHSMPAAGASHTAAAQAQPHGNSAAASVESSPGQAFSSVSGATQSSPEQSPQELSFPLNNLPASDFPFPAGILRSPPPPPFPSAAATPRAPGPRPSRLRSARPRSSQSVQNPATPGRRTAHNAIERRYRNNLNDSIFAFVDLVPAVRVTHRRENGRPGEEPEELSPQERAELEGLEPARKVNKANILTKTAEYIRHLKGRRRHLEVRCREQREEIDALKARLEEKERALAMSRL